MVAPVASRLKPPPQSPYQRSKPPAPSPVADSALDSAPEPSPPSGGAPARSPHSRRISGQRDQDKEQPDAALLKPVSRASDRPASSQAASSRPSSGLGIPRTPTSSQRTPGQAFLKQPQPAPLPAPQSSLADPGLQGGGGHAAGTATLSLREKVQSLQRQNKALEEKVQSMEQVATDDRVTSSALASTSAAAATASATAVAAAAAAQIAAADRLSRRVADLEALLLSSTAKNSALVQQAATLAGELQQRHRSGGSSLELVGPSTPSDDGLPQPLVGTHSPSSSFSGTGAAAGVSEAAQAASAAAHAAMGGAPRPVATAGPTAAVPEAPGTPAASSKAPAPPSPPPSPGSPVAAAGSAAVPSPPPGSPTGGATRLQPVAPPARTGAPARPTPSVARQRSAGVAVGVQATDTALSTSTDGIAVSPTAAAATAAVAAAPSKPAGTAAGAAAAAAAAAATAEVVAAAQAAAVLAARHAEQLRKQLLQANSAIEFLRKEHAEVEALQKDTEAQRREFAARYAFCVLDDDNDGYILSSQVQVFDLFQPYSTQTIDLALKHWKYASGFKGYFTMEDFLRFVTLADERSTRESQRFWFNVIDMDGDGCISCEDAKCFYDAVPKGDGFVVSFEDLWFQLLDMIKPTAPRSGFTASDLWRCKLGAGALGLLTNHNNMLLQRSTAEWGRGDYPL